MVRSEDFSPHFQGLAFNMVRSEDFSPHFQGFAFNIVRSEDFSPHFQGLAFSTLKLDCDEITGLDITNMAEVTKVWQPKN